MRFANGREEAIPDVTPLLKPSTLGTVATYLLFGSGGLFIGGEMGVLSGGFSARNKVGGDVESRRRIDAAFRNFRADVLEKQARDLKSGGGAVWV